MTLLEIIRTIDRFDPGLTIYAVYPFQPSSNALVARPRDDGRVPDEAVAAGCRYFLEVCIALQALHQARLARGPEAPEEELCARLIEYAEFVSSDVKPYPFLKWKFPVTMMIYCRGCGKHFDIVVTNAGPRGYRCPACEKVQTFDLDAFTRKALEQSRKMFKKPRGGR